VRRLEVIDGSDPSIVGRALRVALANDGPALLPREFVGGSATGSVGGAPTSTPASVVDDVAQEAVPLGDPSVGRTSTLPTEVPRSIALVIETSGSSGLPKRVALSADALLSSAAAAEGALGGPGQWLLALPTHYIAGVQVLVRSIAADTTPLVLGRGHFSARDFAALADRLDAPVRYTSLVPAQLARLVAAAEEDAGIRRSVARFDAVLVGGQALPAALHERALTVGIAVVRTYGSSETAGGCVYDGRPIGQTLARTRGGELELSGPSLAVGYLGDEELSEAKFYTDDGVRWYRTGDAGTIEGSAAAGRGGGGGIDAGIGAVGDGSITGDAESQGAGVASAGNGGTVAVTGRLDNVIISGGIKVSLDRVERIVQWVPGFEEAVVVGAPDEEWGQVGVVVVEESALAAASAAVAGTAAAGTEAAAASAADDGADAAAGASKGLTTTEAGVGARGVHGGLLEQVRRVVADAAGRAAAPARLRVVERLPRLSSGKPDRQLIASRLQDDAD